MVKFYFGTSRIFLFLFSIIIMAIYKNTSFNFRDSLVRNI